jgi:protein SCO1/2
VKRTLLLSLFAVAWAAGRAPGAPSPNDVKVEPRPGNQVPADAVFRDDSNENVELGHYFGDKPVILVLAYYRCPRLCTEVLNDLSKGLQGVRPYTAGRDFQVVVVSFDAREKPDLAAAKKRSYVDDYGRPGAEGGWHFLTGTQPEIDRVKEAVGFKAVYDPKDDQFVHDSAVIFLTPGGKVARYLFGLGYKPRDVRLALVESAEGKIGTVLDHVLLLCYHYDPATGKYSATVLSIVRVGGALTVLALIAFWVRVFLRGQRKTDVPVTG